MYGEIRIFVNCRTACFYYLCVDGTTEESDIFRDCSNGLENQVSFMDLNYDSSSGEFSNYYYSRIAGSVITRARESGWNGAAISELSRHLRKGVIACDWLMAEKECEEIIGRAKDKSERNYYTAMLYFIRERGKYAL